MQFNISYMLLQIIHFIINVLQMKFIRIKFIDINKDTIRKEFRNNSLLKISQISNKKISPFSDLLCLPFLYSVEQFTFGIKTQQERTGAGTSKSQSPPASEIRNSIHFNEEERIPNSQLQHQPKETFT